MKETMNGEEGETRERERSLSWSLRHVYRLHLFVASSRTNKLQHTALLHSRVRSPRGNAASYHGCHGCQAHQGPWLSAAPAHGAYGAEEEKKASTTLSPLS
ncbi:hypothetical protein K0M31_017903 [Melipona bicolor]|uniref:Uncharacterized protein n=1 Tax=Melipona bicolor TaxID=60889 RepID=A0AA40G5S0_9HYME|nr:hypothetical protein K0M31_017903 [Melipona bicolor]